MAYRTSAIAELNSVPYVAGSKQLIIGPGTSRTSTVAPNLKKLNQETSS